VHEVTSPKQWREEAIETALSTQGIALAPGRAKSLARELQVLLEASAADPLLASVEFQADPYDFHLALARTMAQTQ
jgi:hypothetical protein